MNSDNSLEKSLLKVKVSGELFFRPGWTPEHFDELLREVEKDKLPNLQSLNFRGCNQLSENSLVRIAEAAEKDKLPNLQSLDFESCKQLSENSLSLIHI